MPILSKGTTFADGDQVTSTKLNNLVDAAAFVTGSSGTTDDATLEVNGSGRLQVKTIQTGNIASGAIVESKLATDAVTTAKIKDSTGASDGVTTAKLATGAVTEDKLADNAVTNAKLDDDAVNTAEITDAAVTAPKLNGAQTGSAPIYGVRAWVNFDSTTADDLTGTYSRTSPSTTATISITSHGLITGQYVYLDFSAGTTDGIYQVTVVDANSFTVTTVATTTQSSTAVTLPRVTILEQGNVSFVSKVSTGRFIVNFTTPMPNANYCYCGSGKDTDTVGDIIIGRPSNGIKNANSIELRSLSAGASGLNFPEITLMFIG
jgi:hypothetical protein